MYNELAAKIKDPALITESDVIASFIFLYRVAAKIQRVSKTCERLFVDDESPSRRDLERKTCLRLLLCMRAAIV